MPVRAAYIRSLGTTGILVLAALLMLGMVGALVGFHRWPEGAAGDPVPSVPLKSPPPRVLTAVRTVHRNPAGAHHRRTQRPARDTSATAGLVKVVPVSATPPVGSPVALDPGEVAPTSPPAATPAGDPAAPPSAPSKPEAPHAPSPQEVQALVDQLVESVPPPPTVDVTAQPGQPVEVGVSILGAHITVPPPLPSR